jgi:hypothetical protein
MLEGDIAVEAVAEVTREELEEQSKWFLAMQKYYAYQRYLRSLYEIPAKQFDELMAECDRKIRDYTSGISDTDLVDTIRRFSRKTSENPCEEIELPTFSHNPFEKNNNIKTSGLT